MNRSCWFGGRFLLVVLSILFSLAPPAQGDWVVVPDPSEPPAPVDPTPVVPPVDWGMKLVRYVKPDPSGSGNGNSWDNAMGASAFRTAVSSASPDTYFWLAKGVYTPEPDKPFEPARGVAIYGGFKGNEKSPDGRDPKTNATILEGSGSRVINVASVPSGEAPVATGYIETAGNGKNYDLVIDGLTVTLGSWESGGGTYLGNGSDVLARGCIFIRNDALDGGAVFLDENVTFDAEGCIFSNNTCKIGGGSVFIKRTAKFTSKNCTFKSNGQDKATGLGGAVIVLGDASFTADGCTFEANSSMFGGAVFVWSGGEFTAQNCTFAGNTAFKGGALDHEGNSKIINCTFYDNKADEKNNGQSAFLSSNNGGFKAVNSIFWGKSILPPVHGLWKEIVSGETPNLPEISYCIIKGGYDGNDAANHISNKDPKLGELKFYGGPTETMTLLAGSPAIDAGTSKGAPKTDQRGIERPQGSGIDIGAFELVPLSGGGGCSTVESGVMFVFLPLPLACLLPKRSRQRGL